MAAARIRLAVASVLFLGWIAWLAYLAVSASNPIVLSRPQFLASKAWVIAELTGDDHPDANVVIREVVWKDNFPKLKPGSKELVIYLDKCTAANLWRGPGEYILPLIESESQKPALTPIPISPGFNPGGRDPIDSLRRRLRIYPLTADTRRQLDYLKTVWNR